MPDRVERLDFGRLKKAVPTPQGGVRVPAYLTRVGVFAYRNPDGTVRRELRPPDEVFKADSLATLAGAPVTDLHPTVPVRADNWRKLAVGHVGDQVAQDGNMVAGELRIQDADMITRIDAGQRREVSLGYRTRLDMTPGEYEGEPYDAVQRDIQYNHVALGPANWGRAGSEVALRLDSAGNQILGDTVAAQPLKDKHMTKVIRIDGVEYEVGSEAHLAKIDADHRKETAELTARADAAEARADAAASEVEGLKAQLTPDAIAQRVNARVELLATARKVLGESYRSDAKSDRDVMIDVIRHDRADFDPAEKSDDYVRAYFDARRDQKTTVADVRAAVVAPVEIKTDSKHRTAEQARAEMLQRNAEAWTQPLRVNR